ncbi:hypothetical protein LTR85_001345 [Meristemomyces frigidus]|nr:hypothetical protein LTR85_001345 [Meristemomyces frigidus]
MEVSPQQSKIGEQSPLLRLPAELRNVIYELLVADCGNVIIFNHKTATNIHGSLASVNRQLRHEFRPILRDQIKPMHHIQARVHAFDLDRLNHFINYLPPSSRGGERTVDVTLVFEGPARTFDLSALRRWGAVVDLRRGRGARVEYKADVDWSTCAVAAIREVGRAVNCDPKLNRYGGHERLRINHLLAKTWRRRVLAESEERDQTG